MNFNVKCVVVKFHDKEKYAIAVRCGSERECNEFAAYCRGLYHDTPYITFGVFHDSDYEFWYNQAIEREQPAYEYVYRCLCQPYQLPA